MALGIDITETKRFEKYINNDKFFSRVFTENEKMMVSHDLISYI